MATQRTMVFVDGENLVLRYQAMIEAGRKPDAKLVHLPDALVWHPKFTGWAMFDMVRVLYYTSTVGDDDKVAALNRQIAEITYSYAYESDSSVPKASAQLVPRVFKKPSNSRKSRHVDLHITIDAMRSAFLPNVDLLIIY